MDEKLAAVDHLRPLMQKGTVLFGATILGRGVAPNLAARALLDLYNEKGVFDNREDDLADGWIAAAFRPHRHRNAGSGRAVPCRLRRDRRHRLGIAINPPPHLPSFAPVQS
jgi:hypothetical protein